MTTLQFGSLVLDTTQNCAKLISKLEVSTDADTEDKNYGVDGYVWYKSAKASEVNLTVILDAGLGCDVRKETGILIEAARTGKRNYLYLDAERLVPWKMILTEAKAEEIQIGLKGEWIHAEVELTFQQGEIKRKNDVSGGNSQAAEDAMRAYQEMMMTVRKG